MSTKWARFDWERLNLDPPAEVKDWDETLLLQFRGQCYNARANFIAKMLLLQDLQAGRQFAGVLEFDSPSGGEHVSFDLSQFNPILATPRNRQIRIQETRSDMMRALLDDTWRSFEYFAKGAPAIAKGIPRPELSGAKYGVDRLLQQLGHHLGTDERWLLTFFENVRNCLAHYGGRYARHIPLQGVFYGQAFDSVAHLGRSLPISPPIALALHAEVHRAVCDAVDAAGLGHLPGIDLTLEP
ncbi:MAG: hypothetical protein MUE84_11285 [Hyphomonas sp.]|jgi:hypothetical protein|nr:hypothetical protein [Hyphomonas sp.]